MRAGWSMVLKTIPPLQKGKNSRSMWIFCRILSVRLAKQFKENSIYLIVMYQYITIVHEYHKKSRVMQKNTQLKRRKTAD